MSRLNRFSQLLTTATFLLIVAGGLVTSTDSGLAVPDWPLSFGRFFPRMAGGVLFEHTHRMIAGTIGLLTLALVVWIFRREKRAWLRWFSLAALLAVIAQAILGGVTVLYRLPTAISVTHACLAQTFFCLIAAIALFTSREWIEHHPESVPNAQALHWAAITTTTIAYTQLVLGAFMRHTHGQGIGWHVFSAFLLLASVLLLRLVIASRQEFSLKFLRSSTILSMLVLAQIFLGLGAFIYTRVLAGFSSHRIAEVFFTTTHQSLGALILAISFVLGLRSFRCFNQGRRASYHGFPRGAWEPEPYIIPQPEPCIIPHSHALRGNAATDAPRLTPFLELTKPRLTLLALATTFLGFYLGSWGSWSSLNLALLANTLLGAVLVGGGANALNQYLERDTDAKMTRTQNRPIPSGRISPESALLFGVLLSTVGVICLAIFVNLLTSLLGVISLVSYLFVYTPLKRKTSLCTLVGAIPGALPPVIGWAAARGELTLESWVLFSILYLWQLPHFLAIAWLCREDYARAGFPMLTVLDPDGKSTSRQVALYCLALLPVALVPAIIGITGPIYFFAALLLGLGFAAFGLRMLIGEPAPYAQKFFLSSIVYLLGLIIFMMGDKI